MSFASRLRAVLALATAYAVALQVILLAIAGPLGTGAALAGAPICSHFGAGGSAPAGPAGGCIGTCFGCCCGPPVCPTFAPAMTFAPALAQTIAIARMATPRLLVSAAHAHRSRAPPLA
jgi:hypothetical protein